MRGLRADVVVDLLSAWHLARKAGVKHMDVEAIAPVLDALVLAATRRVVRHAAGCCADDAAAAADAFQKLFVLPTHHFTSSSDA